MDLELEQYEQWPLRVFVGIPYLTYQRLGTLPMFLAFGLLRVPWQLGTRRSLNLPNLLLAATGPLAVLFMMLGCLSAV